MDCGLRYTALLTFNSSRVKEVSTPQNVVLINIHEMILFLQCIVQQVDLKGQQTKCILGSNRGTDINFVLQTHMPKAKRFSSVLLTLVAHINSVLRALDVHINSVLLTLVAHINSVLRALDTHINSVLRTLDAHCSHYEVTLLV